MLGTVSKGALSRHSGEVQAMWTVGWSSPWRGQTMHLLRARHICLGADAPYLKLPWQLKTCVQNRSIQIVSKKD